MAVEESRPLAVARLPVAMRGASAVFSGSRLYVAGGTPRHVFVVDTESGTVTEVKALPNALPAPVSNLDYLASGLR